MEQLSEIILERKPFLEQEQNDREDADRSEGDEQAEQGVDADGRRVAGRFLAGLRLEPFRSQIVQFAGFSQRKDVHVEDLRVDPLLWHDDAKGAFVEVGAN